MMKKIEKTYGFDIVSNRLYFFPLDGRLPEVVLDINASARWVIEEYPYSGLEAIDGGRVRVRLPVASHRWLERLLLRLGPEVTLVEGGDGLGLDIRSAAASRILARYNTGGDTGGDTGG